jgi:hypothetical protein
MVSHLIFANERIVEFGETLKNTYEILCLKMDFAAALAKLWHSLWLLFNTLRCKVMHNGHGCGLRRA